MLPVKGGRVPSFELLSISDFYRNIYILEKVFSSKGSHLYRFLAIPLNTTQIRNCLPDL